MSIPKVYQTKSAKQTFSLGKKLARQLKGGEILALTGQLGAGKTVLIKGIAAGLGIKKIITSPTFVLMKIYKLPTNKFTRHASRAKRANLPTYQLTNLIHLDCYRIKSPQEIIDIGATEYFGRKDTVTVIEWAEKISSILPTRQTNKIKIKLEDKNQREIIIR
jgi:tRNA threonylcarbamoyladenosine biosynthesis protein TsaE